MILDLVILAVASEAEPADSATGFADSAAGLAGFVANVSVAGGAAEAAAVAETAVAVLELNFELDPVSVAELETVAFSVADSAALNDCVSRVLLAETLVAF